MLRCLVILASILSIVNTVQALPVDGSPRADTQHHAYPSEPTTLMGRQYQLAKRDPIILMDPALERAASEQRHNHAGEPQLLRKRVEPFPRYVRERSMDALQVREIHTPAHTASKQPPPNKFSEPAPPPPLPPHNGEGEGYSSHVASTQEYSGASKHREAYTQQNSGLGLAGLGLGGSGGGAPGVGALGLGASGAGHSSESGLTALGGLISG